MRTHSFSRDVKIAEGISAIKNLLRKILKGRPPAFAVFIVAPHDENAAGEMGVKRYVNLADERQGSTLLSAIDNFLEAHRPKDDGKVGGTD